MLLRLCPLIINPFAIYSLCIGKHIMLPDHFYSSALSLCENQWLPLLFLAFVDKTCLLLITLRLPGDSPTFIYTSEIYFDAKFQETQRPNVTQCSWKIVMSNDVCGMKESGSGSWWILGGERR